MQFKKHMIWHTNLDMKFQIKIVINSNKNFGLPKQLRFFFLNSIIHCKDKALIAAKKFIKEKKSFNFRQAKNRVSPKFHKIFG